MLEIYLYYLIINGLLSITLVYHMKYNRDKYKDEDLGFFERYPITVTIIMLHLFLPMLIRKLIWS